MSEKSFHYAFKWDFDWLEINSSLVEQYCSKEIICAFDPSYIPKSGKLTPGLGWHWSGVQQKMCKGLEIGVLSFIDVAARTAMHANCIQTPTIPKGEKDKLIPHYVSIIKSSVDVILSKTKYLCVDGYFMKKSFIKPIQESGLHIITKMRSDANLKYLFNGKKECKRGRPKIHDGKVDVNKIDKRKIKKVGKINNAEVYSANLYCNTLEANVRILFIYFDNNTKPVILLCTDLNLDPKKIFEYYGLRFQIEFLIRDAKQHCGLTQCESRDSKKLENHFNISLTAISLAKANYHLQKKDPANCQFSMTDIKTLHINQLVTNRIFSKLEIDMNLNKNKKLYEECLQFGRLSA
jgi:hypothetical protein